MAMKCQKLRDTKSSALVLATNSISKTDQCSSSQTFVGMRITQRACFGPTQDSELRLGLKIYTSNKLSSDADDTDSQTTLWEVLVFILPFASLQTHLRPQHRS